MKEGRTLIPTDVGDVVSTFLEKHFTDYISDTFTSEMEDELDEIAEGKREYEKTLRDFYTPFTKAVESKADIEKLTTLGEGPKEFPCPKCGATMVYKLGKGGTFLSCSRFPDCDGSRMQDGTEIKPDEPIGTHPESGLPIYVLTGRFGPYVQEGEMPDKKDKKAEKPRRASIPKEMDAGNVSVEQAVRLLMLPRELGAHPDTDEPVVANTGRFGPYVAHAGDFRSLKGADNPYDITYERALEILKEPKKGRPGEKMLKEIGLNPKTKRMIRVYESKSGRYLKKGFKRITLPPDTDPETLTIEEAVGILKTG
jgi:DNA topoisomerase-1